MNKKNLTLMSLLALCVAAVGGCSEKNNISDIVLEVGNKKYTADELYNQLLSTGSGANEAFNMVLRLVVESSMETTKNIQASADLAAKKFYQEVEMNAQQNGISKKEAEKALLEEKGYKSISELKSDMIYKQKLTRLKEQFWSVSKDTFYNDFIENRLPYLVSHVLVKLDDNTNSNKIANNVNISQKEAEKIFKVIDRFRKGDKFAYVASQESEDPGSTASGGAYYMDTTTSFVDEFLYGTYLFDAYTTKKSDTVGDYIEWGRVDSKYDTLKQVGFINEEAYKDNEADYGSTEDSIEKYYKDGVNFVDMSIVDKLGEVANKTSTGDFHYIGYVDDDTFVTDSGTSEFDSSLNNINSNYTAYARSIIFNRAFNKPGISVIGYDKKPEDVKNCIRFKMGETEKWILTDENKNPIFFVAAKGSSNDLWLHFLTINVSSLDDVEAAKKYFTIKPPKKASDDEEEEEETQPAEEEITYVKQFGDGTAKKERELISKLEGYVKSYATSGSGEEVGDENLLTYAMVKKYMAENKINFIDKNLKDAMNAYISAKEELLNVKHENNMLTTFNGHEEKLLTSEDKLIQMGIKPYECGVVLDSDAYAPINDSTSNGNLCRYVYGKGYQVKMSFFYHSNLSISDNSYTRITDQSSIAHFEKKSGAQERFTTWQWVYVEQGDKSKVHLPTPQVDEGYEFRGWYTSKDLNEKDPTLQKVTDVDYSTSRLDNHTIFYADIVKLTGQYNIQYNYKFAGTDIAVDSAIIKQMTEGENAAKNSYDYTGNGEPQTIKIPKLAFSGKDGVDIEVKGFDANEDGEYEDEYNLVLDGKGIGDTKKINVYFAAKPTKIEYTYVDENGEVIGDVGTTTNAKEFTYLPGETEQNLVIVENGKFTLGDGYEIVSIRHTRTNAPWGEADQSNEIRITQSDIGKTIKVYVQVKSNVGGNE